MKYIHLVTYGIVLGNFLCNVHKKLSARVKFVKTTYMLIHYNNFYNNDSGDGIVITLYLGKTFDFGELPRFLTEIEKCNTAPGWIRGDICIHDIVSVPGCGDCMRGLERCLASRRDIEIFENAYYTMMGPECK